MARFGKTVGFASIAVAFVAAACGATSVQRYPGPARPASEIAAISTDEPTTQIMVLDGERQTNYYARRFEVLPGAHRLSVGFESATVISPRRLVLEFDAAAGKTYTVKRVEQGEEVSFVVSDDATGETVSRFVGDEANE